jgi:hypothetical protein
LDEKIFVYWFNSILLDMCGEWYVCLGTKQCMSCYGTSWWTLFQVVRYSFVWNCQTNHVIISFLFLFLKWNETIVFFFGYLVIVHQHISVVRVNKYATISRGSILCKVSHSLELLTLIRWYIYISTFFFNENNNSKHLINLSNKFWFDLDLVRSRTRS